MKELQTSKVETYLILKEKCDNGHLVRMFGIPSKGYYKPYALTSQTEGRPRSEAKESHSKEGQSYMDAACTHNQRGGTCT